MNSDLEGDAWNKKLIELRAIFYLALAKRMGKLHIGQQEVEKLAKQYGDGKMLYREITKISLDQDRESKRIHAPEEGNVRKTKMDSLLKIILLSLGRRQKL